nr:MAG TPA: Lipopolysaccharide export system ATP-binding protein transport, ABC-transporter, LIPID TRANSPORT [Caudoviricetes sp.]
MYICTLLEYILMIKKYIRIGIVILISLLAVSTYTLYNRNQDIKEEISVSMSNQKAFIAENFSLKEENRVFKFTVEQLNYYNDSILQKMNEVRKELNI